MTGFHTPIAYVVFNRPEHTEKTFAVIREQRPSKLFIIADGPRPGHPTDEQRCEEVRAIVKNVDWPCEVYRNYADSNLGLKRRVSSGLDWVFENVDRAIVLEDDCLAHPDFFRFCDVLLDKYKDDSRVSVITGNNFQDDQQRGDASYYFSKYNHCWGWATWRRAWECYSGDLAFWPSWQASSAWELHVPDKAERRYWERIFTRIRAGAIDSWAYPWTGSVWYRGGLTATPNVNLVSNIGFGADSTHTANPDSHLAAMETTGLGEIRHPEVVVQDLEADLYVFDHTFGGKWMRFPYSWLRLPRRAGGFVYRRLKRSFA